jgi:hypothetical protein
VKKIPALGGAGVSHSVNYLEDAIYLKNFVHVRSWMSSLSVLVDCEYQSEGRQAHTVGLRLGAGPSSVLKTEQL